MNTTSTVEPEIETGAQPDSAQVLAALVGSNLSCGDRRQMVLAAEGLPFTPSQAETLKPLLRRYIDRFYGSEQADDQVAVASAVRKYVALLSPAELPALAELLQVERKAPPAFEMEVAKMVTRKLTAILPEETAALAPLADQLIDLVRSYTNPRLLPKRHCGAIAFDASLALPLLASSHVAELLDRLRKLSAAWFRASIARHARALIADLSRRFPEDRRGRACSALAELAAAADTHLT